MRSSASKIQLSGYDDLFQTNGVAESSGEQTQKVPLSLLFPFKNHPYHVRDDETMRKIADSIAKHGVLTPGIVRLRQEGGYEIVAGHRRKRGSELAGKETMPVFVRELDDDEATIIMVDSNLQREKILPSEKAFAYKMKLEALKHQGQRSDLTSERGVPKLTAREQIALDAGESCGLTVTRYIALARPAERSVQRAWDASQRAETAVSGNAGNRCFESLYIQRHCLQSSELPSTEKICLLILVVTNIITTTTAVSWFPMVRTKFVRTVSLTGHFDPLPAEGQHGSLVNDQHDHLPKLLHFVHWFNLNHCFSLRRDGQ